jgi:3'(2'), 5'-bisphosphate nucleotidase
MSYAERSRLNHFWLVDPMQRSAPGASGRDTCSVNIALIEDRKPIYGVVYEPASNTVYFAALGKGAYRSEGADAPYRLAMRERDGGTMQQPVADPEAPDVPSGPALQICKFADGSAHLATNLGATLEWETAAADAILRAVGLGLKNCQSDEAALYNTVDMGHDCLRIG